MNELDSRGVNISMIGHKYSIQTHSGFTRQKYFVIKIWIHLSFQVCTFFTFCKMCTSYSINVYRLIQRWNIIVFVWNNKNNAHWLILIFFSQTPYRNRRFKAHVSGVSRLKRNIVSFYYTRKYSKSVKIPVIMCLISRQHRRRHFKTLNFLEIFTLHTFIYFKREYTYPIRHWTHWTVWFAQ